MMQLCCYDYEAIIRQVAIGGSIIPISGWLFHSNNNINWQKGQQSCSPESQNNLTLYVNAENL
jgi:hypothetical protein